MVIFICHELLIQTTSRSTLLVLRSRAIKLPGFNFIRCPVLEIIESQTDTQTLAFIVRFKTPPHPVIRSRQFMAQANADFTGCNCWDLVKVAGFHRAEIPVFHAMSYPCLTYT